MDFRVLSFSVLWCLFMYVNHGSGHSESTTPSAIERKTCGNETRRYCPNTGCCVGRDRIESCCYFMQVSDWCPLYNGSDVYCEWGCCYHTEDKICCSFFTMKYSFLLIVAAILVSFLIVVICVSCISHSLSRCSNEPSYTRAF